MIICAAIKLNMNNEAKTELIICGHRQGDCLITITQLSDNWRGCSKVQGFINHKGEFLDRKEAFRHALMCGQLSATTLEFKEEHKEDKLYSEDLY